MYPGFCERDTTSLGSQSAKLGSHEIRMAALGPGQKSLRLIAVARQPTVIILSAEGRRVARQYV